jgi:hypothetical protein
MIYITIIFSIIIISIAIYNCLDKYNDRINNELTEQIQIILFNEELKQIQKYYLIEQLIQNQK